MSLGGVGHVELTKGFFGLTGSVEEVLVRERQYIQHEKGLSLLMKTYVEARPTTSMKKSWLCITSYDENN